MSEVLSMHKQFEKMRTEQSAHTNFQVPTPKQEDEQSWYQAGVPREKFNRKRHAIYLVSIWQTVKPENNSLRKVSLNSGVGFPLPNRKYTEGGVCSSIQGSF